eukprot:TRINITY_DN3833_c0_g2_i1.p1 TRINITY_DN3833_c0_g2~~TRINITY_DN3833_c0_g2_i1.p1  ORF type:complete len:352 (-),score=55.42 TRINITY_DN3833_c0_g2_i1:167-1222(-)
MGQHDKRKAIRRVVFRIVIGLLILAIFSYLLSANITNIIGYEKTIQDVTFSSVLLNIVLQLAKERGLSSIWLASNATYGYNDMLDQRIKTDDAINALNNQPSVYQPEVSVVLNATRFLYSMRSGISGQNITFQEVLDNYGWINGVILDRAGKANLSKGSLVRFYLAEEIEMRGLLRGTMSVAFQIGYWTQELYSRVNGVLAKIDLFQKEVLRYSTDQQIHALDLLRSDNQTAPKIAQTSAYLTLALGHYNASESVPFGVETTMWFNNSSAEIGCLIVFYQEISVMVVNEAQSAKWWDLLVVIVGLILELVSLGEMVIAVLPIIAFGLKWRDLSWAQSGTPTPSNMTTAPSH